MNLTVDAFEIDLELLHDATFGARGNPARHIIAEAVRKNLDAESTKRFEEYQKQNDPCEVER